MLPRKRPAIFVTSVLFFIALVRFEHAQSSCDVINDADVFHFDIRLPDLMVPVDLTTYTCQQHEIPVDLRNVYHAVAFEPIIVNPDVMHHMLLFGCTDRPSDTEAHVCRPEDNKCRTFIMQWSMGVKAPICLHPNAGVRFGQRFLRSLNLQIHWNNPHGRASMTDSSGVRVYYTRNLRAYDLGYVQVGQNDLEIPAGQGHYPQIGSCSSACTSRWLKEPIYLTRANIHMHYTGDSSKLQLVRNEYRIRDIAIDKGYNYSNPPAHYFTEPVQVLPGDEVRLTCYFNTRDGSKQRNRTLYWGEGSDGEMCYAFIAYYPKIAGFDQCVQFDKYDVCNNTG